MPRTRSLRRVLPGRVHERTYTDLDGPGLAAHVAKHVLDPEEGWAARLGMDIPAPPDRVAVEKAAASLQAGLQLETARRLLRERYDVNGDRILERLLCDAEIKSLRRGRTGGSRELLEVLRDPAPEPRHRGAKWGGGRPYETIEQARVSGLLPLLVSAIVHLDLTDALLAKLPEDRWLRGTIKRARREMTNDRSFTDFVTTWALSPQASMESIRSVLGSRYDEVARAYLDASHQAAMQAGALPRHCRYDRSSALHTTAGIEGYMADEGVAVVIGPDGEGGRRLYTSHVPTLARSGGHLAAASRELLRNEWGPATTVERRLFWEEISHGNAPSPELYSPENWWGTP